MFRNPNTTFHLKDAPGLTPADCPGGAGNKPGCISFAGGQIHGGVLDTSTGNIFGQSATSSAIGNRELQYSIKLIF